MDAAFFCRTPIHVFRAVQLKGQLLPREGADVYLFDTFPNSDAVARRLRQIGMFANVYEIAEDSYRVQGRAGDLRTCLKLSDFSQLLEEQNYRQLFGFNLYGAFNDLALTRLKKYNPRLTFHMVEDGPSLYAVSYRKPKTKRYLYPLLGLRDAMEEIDCWWFSRPDQMHSLGRGEKRSLPPVDRNDPAFRERINHVFAYRPQPLLHRARLVFMEECYRQDGLLQRDRDVELFDGIRRAFPRQACLVKRHPRSTRDRFSPGFPVMPDTEIPWEVYALNENLEEKILISLSCATMVSAKLLFDQEPRALMLYPLAAQDIQAAGRPYLTAQRQQMLCRQAALYRDKTRLRTAQSLEQALEIVRNWLEEEP